MLRGNYRPGPPARISPPPPRGANPELARNDWLRRSLRCPISHPIHRQGALELGAAGWPVDAAARVVAAHPDHLDWSRDGGRWRRRRFEAKAAVRVSRGGQLHSRARRPAANEPAVVGIQRQVCLCGSGGAACQRCIGLVGRARERQRSGMKEPSTLLQISMQGTGARLCGGREGVDALCISKAMHMPTHALWNALPCTWDHHSAWMLGRTRRKHCSRCTAAGQYLCRVEEVGACQCGIG